MHSEAAYQIKTRPVLKHCVQRIFVSRPRQHRIVPGLVFWLALLLGGLAWVNSSFCATVVWTGADAASNVNTNWSDSNNWSGGTPSSGNSIYFFDQGTNGTQGLVDNIVDNNTTMLYLDYGNTNGFHTTQINSGVRLMVSNNAVANLVFVGTGTDNGTTESTYTTMKGPGSFIVAGTNVGSMFIVQQGSANSGSHMATLDMSGLAYFNININLFEIGAASPSTGGYNWLDGTLYLAGTNVIRAGGAAPAVEIGDAVSNGGTSYLYLGQTNAFYADSMTVAHSKATATLAFNPALIGSSPSMWLNGNTNARMGVLAVGDFSAQNTSGSTVIGMMDLTGGTVNALVDTCIVGLGQSGNGPGTTTGTLRIGAGLFNVNTLDSGYDSVSSAVGAVTGNVLLTNGTLVVNSNVLLGFTNGATASCTGTFTITNGTALVNQITAGGGTSKVALSGGLLAVSNTMGTLAAPLTSLTVNKGATLEFWLGNNQPTNAATKSVVSDNTGVITLATLPIVLTYPTRFPLIACPSGGANGVKFAVGSLPNNYQGTITNDNTSTIWLVITNGPTLPKTNVWAGGVNNLWDTNTLNWTSNSVPVTYNETDLVIFNDSAQTNIVNIVGTAPHMPYSWMVSNNVLNYKFIGTNSIYGPATLTKLGTATLTLADNGNTFAGGIVANGGTLVLDETNNTIGGNLNIGAGGTVQIGNNDGYGDLPSGTVTNNGSLIFNQTITNGVGTTISGSGTLLQNGIGGVVLSNANYYTGSTLVSGGTLALTAGGSIARSTNIVVNGGRLDVSTVPGASFVATLNLTNSILNLGATNINASALHLGGTANTINVAVVPSPIYYPTNVLLIQTTNGITGYNFVLGSLPAASPPFAGSLVQSNQAVVLTLTSGPLVGVNATVTFSPTNMGLPLNPAFCGLSYEKSELTSSLFSSNDVSLVNTFAQIAPAVLRVGGNSVDTTCWGGLSNLTAITQSQVDAFAGFVKALPTNWHVIYGINMSVNNPSNCAAEAAYVAKALGPSLLGFEIGNECDLYSGNGLRPPTYTYAQFLPEWRALAAAVTNTVPGYAITNGGNGWTLTGPVSAYNTSVFTVPFASAESNVVSLLSQHYYRANGQSPTSTLQLLLQPDTGLPGTVNTLVAAANAANLPLGFRMAECGSFYNGGAPNVSDAYGTALWALDYMFTLAVRGCQGINFHGGGSGTGYTPIADNGTAVIQARPEFYGLKMFSMLSQGNVMAATVTLASNINFTAYGVRRPAGGMSALLNNKETNDYVKVTVNLGPDVTGAQWLVLNGPALDSTNGYTIGGAVINPDGSWSGGLQGTIPATNGQLTVYLPPITAMILNPVVVEGTNVLLSSDAINTSAWTGNTNWTDGWSPHSGANYFTSTNMLRTPTSGSVLTFAGDSLTVGPSVPGNSSMKLKFNAPGGTYVINVLTNAGGIIDAGISNTTNYLSGTNWVMTLPGGFGMANDNTRTIVLTNLVMSGSATVSNGVANTGDGAGTITYAGDATRFTGPLVTSLGTTLLAYSQTNLGGAPGSFNAAQFVLDDGIFQPLASMALSNANSGVTINPGGGLFNIAPGLSLTIAGPIAGTGALTNNGGGTLIFSGTNSYTGPTMISAGTLALAGNGSIAGTPLISVAGGAALDFSGLNSPFTLGNGQVLSNSAVRAVLGGNQNSAGGTFSLLYDGVNPSFIVTNGSLNLSGNTVFKINNTGAQLALGGSYKVIARAVTGIAGTVAGTSPGLATVTGSGTAGVATLQMVGGELYVDVVPGAATNLTYAVNGNQLNLSWPTNYTGWVLQSNSVSVNSSNWFPVPGSGSTNRVQIIIDQSQANVFYRLILP